MRFMQKIVALFLAVVLSIISTEANANSGPTYWQGYPSAEILAVAESCPIEVKREKLVFDFSEEDNHDYSPKAEVTASYELVNPTEQDLTVQMAFPFICSLQDYADAKVAITVDQQVVPFELYFGEKIGEQGRAGRQRGWQIDFAQILKTITKQPYRGKHFSWNELGRLYVFKIKPTSELGVNFAIDFEFDPTRTRVLVKGFNRFEREGQKVRIAARCREPEVLEIFVLGKDVDFHKAGYIDGELQEKTVLYECEELSKEKSLKDYLTKYIEQDNLSLPEAEENQLSNLYGARLDEIFAEYESFCPLEELAALNQVEHVFTLVFTTDFPAQASQKLSVSYQATGTMDKTRTVHPTYTYTYLLNPAQNWADFGKLNIEIRTPEKAPYIVDSNIDFKQEGERLYTARLASLPENDLFFTLYWNKKFSFLDQVFKLFTNNDVYFLRPCFLLVLIFAGYLGVKRRNKKTDIL